MEYGIQYIVDRVTIVNSTQCWEWTKSLSNGYGQFVIADVGSFRTHRYIYECIHGTQHASTVIRHTCHNRKCCNPDHLIAGTHTDNYHDSVNEHASADKKRRKSWIVNGITYDTCRSAETNTGLTATTLIKYTDATTRIFDISAYHLGCEIGNKRPLV